MVVFPSLSPVQVIEKTTPRALHLSRTSIFSSPHWPFHFHLPWFHKQTSYKISFNTNGHKQQKFLGKKKFLQMGLFQVIHSHNVMNGHKQQTFWKWVLVFQMGLFQVLHFHSSQMVTKNKLSRKKCSNFFK